MDLLENHWIDFNRIEVPKCECNVHFFSRDNTLFTLWDDGDFSVLYFDFLPTTCNFHSQIKRQRIILLKRELVVFIVQIRRQLYLRVVRSKTYDITEFPCRRNSGQLFDQCNLALYSLLKLISSKPHWISD
jgi:hypothetical protein